MFSHFKMLKNSIRGNKLINTPKLSKTFIFQKNFINKKYITNINNNVKEKSKSFTDLQVYILLIIGVTSTYGISMWVFNNSPAKNYKGIFPNNKDDDDEEYLKPLKTCLNYDLNQKLKYGGQKELLNALPEFKEVLGENGISTDDEDLKAHGYSSWSTYNIDTYPIAVAYPKSTKEVSEIAKICTRYHLPMIGFSGGSSLEGNFCAPYGGICIDFCYMDKILKLRADDLDVTVQPAVGWMALNEYLDANNTGLIFPVDPGPTAEIGGMVSTSCSGTNCVRYGPMRNHIVNLTVVLADGTIIKTRQRPRKTSAGYNLNHFFAGSEGTLGLITEITLKLDIKPQVTRIAMCSFPSIHSATKAATDVVKNGILVNALELMDAKTVSSVNKAGRGSIKYKEEPTLLYKFSGTKSSVEEQIEQTKKIAKENGGNEFLYPSSEKEMKDLWSARKEFLWSMLSLGPPNPHFWGTDVAVPLSKLADAVTLAHKELENLNIFGSIIGHVGDGNYHVGIVFEKDNKEDLKKVKEYASRIVHQGLDLEGTCTGEHGIGAGKIDYLLDELGVEPVLLMRTIKLALDPYQLMNPGKIFTDESIRNKMEIEKKKQRFNRN